MAAFNHFSSQTIAFAASQGVSAASLLVPAAGVIALLGGLSILLGYRAKLGGWLIALLLIGVTPMHKFWSIADPMTHQIQMVVFMKNLSMLGGALLITQPAPLASSTAIDSQRRSSATSRRLTRRSVRI